MSFIRIPGIVIFIPIHKVANSLRVSARNTVHCHVCQFSRWNTRKSSLLSWQWKLRFLWWKRIGTDILLVVWHTCSITVTAQCACEMCLHMVFMIQYTTPSLCIAQIYPRALQYLTPSNSQWRHTTKHRTFSISMYNLRETCQMKSDICKPWTFPVKRILKKLQPEDWMYIHSIMCPAPQ